MAVKSRQYMKNLRHERLRKKVSGTAEIPRLAVCKTARHIHVQIINDEIGKTLCAVSTDSKDFRTGAEGKNFSNVKSAKALGEKIAATAAEKGIKEVVYDRGGTIYHGVIKELADAARAAGLKF